MHRIFNLLVNDTDHYEIPEVLSEFCVHFNYCNFSSVWLHNHRGIHVFSLILKVYCTSNACCAASFSAMEIFFFQTHSTGPKWLLFNFKSMKSMDVSLTDELFGAMNLVAVGVILL